MIEYKEGGNPIILKGLGRTKYEPITLERGVTYDTDFEDLGERDPDSRQRRGQHSLANLRKEIPIELLNEEGQPVHALHLIAAGFRSSRRFPISMPGPTRSRSSTSSSRTKAGSAILD